jgi:hypothetical protein
MILIMYLQSNFLLVRMYLHKKTAQSNEALGGNNYCLWSVDYGLIYTSTRNTHVPYGYCQIGNARLSYRFS